MFEETEELSLYPTEDFQKWLKSFKANDRAALQRINARLRNMTNGHFGQTRSVGEGVIESKIDFARRGKIIVLLLLGGSKKTQSKDIERAKEILLKVEI
ncbi:type II toxin-antitoxin system RelE/ParE family toxin [uncultured Parasutterella sp.]|uniref:type II toxin-antitoxin system RelE/ParE family toxin n=1 Tax=uncultured Parasutterella sp. TaxID=1263098 RepID=UPI00261324BD|nr:type II toxin-antitoxin system RelE/ParE family toxin [uncultured Parasutterella sp.]